MEFFKALDPMFWVSICITALIALAMIIVFWSFPKYDPEKKK